jgi:F-type H+-transporting ATPase subunit b
MRTGLIYRLAFVAGLLAACGLAAPAFADNAAAKKEGEKHAETKDGDHGEKEKDKTAFMGIKRYDLGIYTLIVFGALFFILGKYAWKPIMTGLQKREDAIVTARTDAERARSEAQKLLDEVKAQRAKSNEDVAAIIAEARKDADAFREAEKTRTAADIQAERVRLKREIETAKDQALQEIWSKSVELAALISAKAVHRELNPDDHRRLLDEALAELKQSVSVA